MQVAFVEEPFVLSKNQTGMVITLRCDNVCAAQAVSVTRRDGEIPLEIPLACCTIHRLASPAAPP